MKLGKLYENFNASHSEFLNMYRNNDLMNCKTLKDIKENLKAIFEEADNYAKAKNLKFKYFDLAKKPLWEGLDIDSRYFILKGFDAYIKIDLNESLDDIVPYVFVLNENTNHLKAGQVFEINEELVESLVPYQKQLFLEELKKLEDETVSTLQKVWDMERKRIDKWVDTCKVDLKGA